MKQEVPQRNKNTRSYEKYRKYMLGAAGHRERKGYLV